MTHWKKMGFAFLTLAVTTLMCACGKNASSAKTSSSSSNGYEIGYMFQPISDRLVVCEKKLQDIKSLRKEQNNGNDFALARKESELTTIVLRLKDYSSQKAWFLAVGMETKKTVKTARARLLTKDGADISFKLLDTVGATVIGGSNKYANPDKLFEIVDLEDNDFLIDGKLAKLEGATASLVVDIINGNDDKEVIYKTEIKLPPQSSAVIVQN
jgi:hypothetical protein